MRRHRIARGLSQEVLAERAGLSLRGLSDLERGVRRLPHATTVGRLVEALGLVGQDREALIASTLRSVPPAAVHARHTGLPTPLTSFVGRDADLAALHELLAGARLVTLVGAGGIGKTRLALEAARTGTLEGVFADLAPLDTAELLPGALAAACGLGGARPDEMYRRLSERLGDRPRLLVLDNCEHLVEGCARVAEELLRACPPLRILATSREPLAAQGEVVWPVVTLGVPSGSSKQTPDELDRVASVRLFLDRAQAAQPGFALTAATAPSIVEICHRLDGLPLALELAASRVRVLGVRKLAERLDDRFEMLVGGQRTAPPRQQTLRATLDWSHDLLTGHERELFARLAVFAGGFTAAAAEAVCGEGTTSRRSVLELLGRLVDRSLLVADLQPDAAVRYRMLETVRQYAHERLEETGALADLRRRHAVFYRALAAQAERGMWSADGPAWLRDLATEISNMRAVVDWGLKDEDHLDVALDTVADLFTFWVRTGRVQEGRTHLEHLLAANGREAPAGAWAVYALGCLGFLADEFGVAERLIREALELAEARGDRRTWAYAAAGVAALELASGRHELAREPLRRALAMARERGDGVAISNLLLHHGELARLSGDDTGAEAFLRQALDTARQQADDWSVAFALFHLGRLARLRGRVARARHWQMQGLELWRGLDDPLAVSRALDELAILAAIEGDYLHAIHAFGAAHALRAPTGAGAWPMSSAERQHALDAARAHLGEVDFDAAWHAGQHLELDHLVSGLVEQKA